jgi:hypothetical protein
LTSLLSFGIVILSNKKEGDKMTTYEVETYNKTYNRTQRTVLSTSGDYLTAINVVLNGDKKAGIDSAAERVSVIYDNGSRQQVWKK